MDTQANSISSIKRKFKSSINIVGIAFAISLFGLVVTMGFTNAFAETVDEYEVAANDVVVAEQALLDAEIRLCKVGRGLAGTKLRDHFADIAILDAKDVDRLVIKARDLCDFQ